MRVLVVHNAGRPDLPSGELRVVQEQIAGLRRHGTHVASYVVHNSAGGKQAALARARAGLNLIWSYQSFVHIRKLIDIHNPDVVHFHSILPLLTVSAFAACKASKVPMIQTLHNYRWFCVEGGLFRDGRFCDDCVTGGAHNGVRHRCSQRSLVTSTLLTVNNKIHVTTKRLFDLVDRFLTVSSYARTQYVRAGFPEDKVFVHPNGVAMDALRLHSDERDVRSGIAFVGRLDRAKGTDVLRHVIGHFRHVPIHIAGDGPEYGPLREFCRVHSLEHVRFYGNVDKAAVYEILRSASCAIVPSLVPETFGLVAVEAMACGTPVVASRIGALPGVVAPGGGLLVEPGDGEGFVRAITRLLEQPAMARELGQIGKQHVADVYDLDRVTKCLLEHYRQVVDGRHRRM